MKYRNLLVISDNPFLISAFQQLIEPFQDVTATYACSKNNLELLSDASLKVKMNTIEVKKEWPDIALTYDLIFSLHCKQLFPAELVAKVKCINVHPGYNPYNRGWFPQVFSILNKLPAGATIHEIDEYLDHGHIIAQRRVSVHAWDTSIDIYNRVQLTEVELLKENLAAILAGSYATIKPAEEGNVNLKKDFNELCEIDLNESTTYGQAIDRFRALTHGKYANAFFVDPETGSRVYITISLTKK